MKELSIGRMNLIIFFGALFSVATEWYLLDLAPQKMILTEANLLITKIWRRRF
ncbi:hypothetical protein [Chryseobacterium bernardetii]|uniref:hypothetical protein n=1 Tax=Chryseobacterium bernardetii TaxID=1241978 RepID=UPI001E40E711|nr:hypothetical protein [Chryseobacterium bernardetii]